MKKIILMSAMVLLTISVMAQSTFPNPPEDPGAVPIVESILGLLGLGAAYVFRMIKKGKKED